MGGAVFPRASTTSRRIEEHDLAGQSASRGVVVSYEDLDPPSHEASTRIEIAKKLAALKGYAFAGRFDRNTPYPGPVYHVPSATLVGTKAARDIGICGEHDLFGGVVPFGFVATKAITHPLVTPEADAPSGWSHAFPETVRHVVLSGYTAFTPQDALRAGGRLLESGNVRVKPVRAEGAHGQMVVSSTRELESAIAAIDGSEISHGVVLEEDLTDVTTCSVGRMVVGDLLATYVGTQRLTTDNRGEVTYGGSTLFVARGDFDELLASGHSAQTQLAVAQARAYDAAANVNFRELIASRRNYDVAQGFDAGGRRRSGVLEQSWRIGGATGAEIVALEALHADPALRAVEASCIEIFGEGVSPPDHAFVYFQGVDRTVGPLTKYAVVEKRHYAE